MSGYQLWSDEIEAMRPEAREMVDKGFAALGEALGRTGSPPADPLERARHMRDSHARNVQLLPECADREIAGVRCRITTPDDGPARAVYLHFHGGGMVAGGLDTHDAMARTLAGEAACAVVAADYRLAPEHKFPAAFDDCRAALRWVGENADRLGLDRERVGVAGDSVGGGLAAAVALATRGLPRLKLQVLLYPVLDPAGETGSRREFASGYFLDRETVARDLTDYCPPGVDRTDPRLAPLRAADFRDLPPAIIVTAGHDPMRDEGETYAAALTAAGVAVVRQPYPGMIHHFLGLGGVIHHAQEAWREIGVEIRHALG
jgi:acetyl esterase/lipase